LAHEPKSRGFQCVDAVLAELGLPLLCREDDDRVAAGDDLAGRVIDSIRVGGQGRETGDERRWRIGRS
jgi:hypothetical protein